MERPKPGFAKKPEDDIHQVAKQAETMAYVRETRAFERVLAEQERRELHDQISRCTLLAGVDYRTKCKEYIEEYAKRLQWDRFVPPAGADTTSVVRGEVFKDDWAN